MIDIFANVLGTYIEDNMYGGSQKIILQHLYSATTDELLVLNCASAGLRELMSVPTINAKGVK